MRIAMFSWESLHSVAVGGLAAHVSELARALALDGHELHVFTRRAPAQLRDQVVDGVAYHRCDHDSSPDLLDETDDMCRSMVRRFFSVSRSAGPFDVVHAHDWLVARTLEYTESSHARRLFTLHSTEFGRCGNVHHEGRSRLIRDREWEGTYHCDRLITVSHHLLEEVRSIYSVPPEKMCVIYNGVNVHRFDGPLDVGSAKERLGLGRTDPVILFCGRLAWQKGPDILLEAAFHLLRFYPRARFLFVGDGDMRPGLEARARRLGIHPSVRFLGHRRGPELVELFKAADVLCVPSRNEPFGIVILEAWAASKPVVVSRNGGPEEFVRNGVDGFTVRDDADSFGWGLGSIFMDFDEARWMGSNGRRVAEERFDWRAIAREVAWTYAQ